MQHGFQNPAAGGYSPYSAPPVAPPLSDINSYNSPNTYGSAPPYTAGSTYHMAEPPQPSPNTYAPPPPYFPTLSTSDSFNNPPPTSSYAPPPPNYAPTSAVYSDSYYQSGAVAALATQLASTNIHSPQSYGGGGPPLPQQYGIGSEQFQGGGGGGYPSGPPPEMYGNNQYGMLSQDLDYGGSIGRPTPTYDQPGGFYQPGGGYAQQPSYDQQYQERPSGMERGQDKGGYGVEDNMFSDVYQYDGGNTEPYGAHGTGASSWASVGSSLRDTGSRKIARAVPKLESQDVSSGIQKYRVKLLPDYASIGSPTDVLCQIGLDGVRMVDPSSSRTIRIYPLDTIVRWEVSEASVLTFWAKSSVDSEPRRIKLQSNSYTTNSILDVLTAACVQFSEMAIKDGAKDANKTSGDSGKGSDLKADKKKAFLADWLTLRSKVAAQEEKQHWVPDEAVTKCTQCGADFGAFVRRHHCRNCGDVFCDKCTQGRIALTAEEDAQPVRVCDGCLAEATQRLANIKEMSNKPPVQQSHVDLAKKLQEEMERNAPRKSASSSANESGSVKEKSGTSVLNCTFCGSISLVSGSSLRCQSCGASARLSGLESGSSTHLSRLNQSSEGSGKKMREVACPTCTVHLQVQVPSHGTETVECGVCQHPFLVSAH